ncbi:MAG: hypothetical protein LH468_10470 [Nocardioides sp.]|nr:hypothetical protein [Nocardioides sp.]
MEHTQPPPPSTRKGSRRAARQHRAFDARALAMTAGVLVAVLAWAVLVLAGIRFGQSARDGERAGWVFMLIAALGAVACLFVALILGSKVLRSLGVAARAPGSLGASRGARRAAGRRAGPRR